MMIALFEGSEKKTVKDLRALYRERLMELVESSRPSDTPQVQDATQAALSEGVPLEPVRPETAPPEVPQAGAPEQSGSDAFRTLAEQIAPKCIEALADAIRGMHNLAASNPDKTKGVIDQLIALSDEARRIGSEVCSLRGNLEFLVGAQEQLAGRAATLEGTVAACAANDRKFIDDLRALTNAQTRDRESEGLAKSAAEERMSQIGQRLTERLDALETRVTTTAKMVSSTSERLDGILEALERQPEASAKANESLSRVEEAEQVLRRRLDTQAEALRALHASEKERGERWQALLQNFGEMAVGRGTLPPLPEGL